MGVECKHEKRLSALTKMADVCYVVVGGQLSWKRCNQIRITSSPSLLDLLSHPQKLR